MTLSRELEIDNAPLQPNGDGMSAVIGAEFREDVLDVPFDSFLGDTKLIGDQFVGVPRSNQPQYFDFPCSQGVVRQVVGELSGNTGWDTLLASMDGANRVEEFFAQEAL